MPHDSGNVFPGFSHDDLKRTASEHFDAGADAGLDKELRFRSGAARVLRRRNAIAADAPSFAVFILGKAPEGLPLKPFLDNGTTALVGFVWFVNEGVHSGRSSALPFPDDDSAVVQHVTETLRCGGLPTIVYDPFATPAEVRYYATGLEDLEDVKTHVLDERVVVTEDAVRDVVTKAYTLSLQNPDVQKPPYRLWEDPQTWKPIKPAEETIGGNIQSALQGAFMSHQVVREMSVMEGGKVDISIAWPDYRDRAMRFDTVLELKVLRSVWNSGRPVSEKETKEHVEEGVRQAADYKKQQMSAEGALYCFDMRKDATLDDCFAHVSEEAKRLDIITRSWVIFNEASAARKYRIEKE